MTSLSPTIAFSLARRPRRHVGPSLARALGLALLLATGPAAAEVTLAPTEGARGAEASAGSAGRLPEAAALAGASVRARCWQDGAMVVDEAGFERADVGTALRESAVTLRRRAGATVMVPFADALCLVTIEE